MDVNSPIAKDPLAKARKIGIPDISFTEKIVPEVKLLLIENNCPELPSKDKVLSDKTDNVIGLLSCPTNINEGWTVVPADPITAWENESLPVWEFPILTSVAKYDVPPIPIPPVTTNVPNVEPVELVL